MFEITATASGSRARAGMLRTLHDAVATPVFMPVGTRGTVRTQTLDQLEQLASAGAPIVLANTYHLMLRPGREALERHGGLHRWMGWRHSLLTDSGGFQLFSLARGCTIREDGAQLRARDGRTVVLSPESSLAMQRAIGADIMMALDHCIPATSTCAEARAAMELTHRWAERSLAAHRRGGVDRGALFGIVQGACFEELRRASAERIVELGFDGFAIGGLAVGESRAAREDTTELVAQLLPTDRPRYLMGVGTPLDLLEAVHRGVDMFDCILPTAWAQQGIAFTSRGRVDLRRGAHALAERPLDPACGCSACTRHARSYLHHLVKCKEPLGWQLLAFHNLAFYTRLMATMRDRIAAGTFAAFHREQRAVLGDIDREDPAGAPGPRPRTKRREPLERGAFAVHQSPHGFASIRHVTSGEIMHSINDPDVEAERVYVAQSSLLAAALEHARPLVVWDVGLGAAHNAMALVRRLERERPHAPVTLISFERDLDAFRLALAHGKHFAHLRHPAPHVLAVRGTFERDALAWRLREGDFLATFPVEPVPDVIFYDPFSAKVDGEMWTIATFRRLFAFLDRPVELFTYTSSTAIRSSMLAAGFHVASGVVSGPKQTTIAFKGALGHPLLGRDWLERRARSTARFGSDVPIEQHPELDALIDRHVQFAPT